MSHKIKCKYAEYMMAPFNAFPAGMGAQYETTDGVLCDLEMCSSWNNDRGDYDDEFDYVCQKNFGCSFSAIRSIWISRLGKVDDYWHLVKLVKVNGA